MSFGGPGSLTRVTLARIAPDFGVDEMTWAKWLRRHRRDRRLGTTWTCRGGLNDGTDRSKPCGSDWSSEQLL